MSRNGARRAPTELVVTVMAAPLSIVRLAPGRALPAWAGASGWCSVTRTAEECSVVCESAHVPADVARVGPWRGLKVAGPLAFELVGVLYRLAGPLAEAGISIFVVSTYDTDYVLVPEDRLDEAVAALSAAGVVVRRAD